MSPVFFALPTSASWPVALNYNIAVFAAARRAKHGMTAHAERNDGVHPFRALPKRMPLGRRTSLKVHRGAGRVAATAARAADRGVAQSERFERSMHDPCRTHTEAEVSGRHSDQPEDDPIHNGLAADAGVRRRICAVHRQTPRGDITSARAPCVSVEQCRPVRAAAAGALRCLRSAQLPRCATSASDVPQPRSSLRRRGCPGVAHARAPSVRVVRACDTTWCGSAGFAPHCARRRFPRCAIRSGCPGAFRPAAPRSGSPRRP